MALPANFDSRERWPGCIADAMNQGKCDGCWAFSTTLTLSDRIRIHQRHMDGTEQLFETIPNPDGGAPILNSLSPRYVITHNLCKVTSSAERGGDNLLCKMSCKGGFINTGIKYLTLHGSISILDDVNRVPDPMYYRASSCYKVEGGVNAISKEILARGPVVAGYQMYENCYDEKFDKFYDRQAGKVLFNHAISIIGWVQRKGKSYWICRNSYGRDYMDDGYFYILRGSDFCGIESEVWAMAPGIRRT